MFIKLSIPAAALALGLAVAGCGSSAPTQTQMTAKAQTCLANAIANKALKGGTNCGNNLANHTLKIEGDKPVSASCTHQAANQYVCQVTGGISNISGKAIVSDGFYDVTFDGQSIVFRRSNA